MLEATNLLQYNLQFFAQDGPGGEKTEDATSKKLSDARQEGQVAKSQEIGNACMLLGLFLSLKIFMGYMSHSFLKSFHVIYGNIDKFVKEDFERNTAAALLNDGLIEILKIAGPVFLFAIGIAFIVNVYQVKWKPTLKPLKPKFSKFDPVKGMKKIFSKDKIFELIKAIVKIAIIGLVVYKKLVGKLIMIPKLYDMDLMQAISYIGDTVLDIGMTVCLVYMIVGLADLFYQKRKFKKDMRMTKQEVKDEFKQTEGDPAIKGRIRQKMREVAQRRMMQSVPDADVVITNPTHYACAIRYDKSSSEAPILVAKGADFLAQKIKEIAKDNKVEIVENKPLARMLYFNVEIGDQIPPELYQMTAEVLAYVYGLKGKAVSKDN